MDLFYGLGFLWIDDEIPVSVMGVTQELGRKRYTVVKPHPERRFHASAPGMGFFLGHRCLESEGHLRFVFQGEDRL